VTELYALTRNTNADELREKLKTAPREDIEAALFNERYNKFCYEWADKEMEKRIPYMGWFWRRCNFYEGRIPVSTDGIFVGVTQSNKWGYPQRLLQPHEVKIFMGYLDAAIRESDKGGDMDVINSNVEAELTALREWMQTLTIEGEPDTE